MSPKRRRKGRYQAPTKKNKRHRERAAPQPNVVVGHLLAETEEAPKAEEAPATPVATVTAMPVPQETPAAFSVTAELKRVGILGGSIIVVLVVLFLVLG